MINEILKSLKNNLINKVIIAHDSISEDLSDILFQSITNIILNKENKDIFIYNSNTDLYQNITSDNIKNYDRFVLNISFYIDVNGSIKIKNGLNHYCDVIIVLKNNKFYLYKHKLIQINDYKNLDVKLFLRNQKIKKIKKK